MRRLPSRAPTVRLGHPGYRKTGQNGPARVARRAPRTISHRGANPMPMAGSAMPEIQAESPLALRSGAPSAGQLDAEDQRGAAASLGVSATLPPNDALAKMRHSGVYVLPLAFGEAGQHIHAALREAL